MVLDGYRRAPRSLERMEGAAPFQSRAGSWNRDLARIASLVDYHEDSIGRPVGCASMRCVPAADISQNSFIRQQSLLLTGLERRMLRAQMKEFRRQGEDLLLLGLETLRPLAALEYRLIALASGNRPVVSAWTSSVNLYSIDLDQ